MEAALPRPRWHATGGAIRARNRVLPHWGDWPLCSIRPSDVDDWIAALSKKMGPRSVLLRGLRNRTSARMRRQVLAKVTGMVDLTRDADGQVRARLLDLVLGRSGPAYSGWLDARKPEFRAQIKAAALDPFRGYANALRDSLSDAVQVLDAFHVVKLGTQVVDEIRRRVQQQQLGRRGHKNDPLYKIRRLLRHGLEHRTERQHARLHAGLIVGDPDGEVGLAWSCYQQLRAIYAGTASLRERRALSEKVVASFPSCPIPEVARLGRTLRAWRSQVLAYFDTDGLSNGGTEASVNVVVTVVREVLRTATEVVSGGQDGEADRVDRLPLLDQGSGDAVHAVYHPPVRTQNDRVGRVRLLHQLPMLKDDAHGGTVPVVEPVIRVDFAISATGTDSTGRSVLSRMRRSTSQASTPTSPAKSGTASASGHPLADGELVHHPRTTRAEAPAPDHASPPSRRPHGSRPVRACPEGIP
jgi:hypothetical protein